MFKVVMTVERGINNYTEVPENWENQNILFWPAISSRDKNADRKLAKLKHNSAPPEQSWEKIACEVKGYYATYKLAREAAKSLASMSTEDEIR